MKTFYQTNLFYTLPFVLLLLLSSCADDGPAGPAGPAGPPGPAGATGSPNVIYGAWFKPDSYEMTTLFGIKNFTHTQQVPAITQEVLDKGVVLVYAKMLGYNTNIWPATQVGQLPITITYNQGGLQTDTWSAHASVGNLKITFVNTGNIYNTIATQHQFRYVIIPGGVADAGGRVASVSSDYVDYLKSLPYKEAMAELGIAD